jgi:nicotinate-nucleotide adenylyltransferase
MGTFAAEMSKFSSSEGGREKGAGQNQQSPHPSPTHAIGLIGGTFDPIHFGHLRMAVELAGWLGLERVRFIPAAQPPHRSQPRTAIHHRVEMTRIAIAGNTGFALDTREVEREGMSYTVGTLKSLRQELGTDMPLWLFMGADAFLGLNTWNNWRQLFELSNIAVAHRPGYRLTHADALGDELREVLQRHQVKGTPASGQAAGQILLRPVTQLDISATAIRNAIREGISPRYLLPEAVLHYIHTHHLYLPA